MTVLLWIFIALCFMALALWGFWIEPSRIRFRQHTIHIKNWPQQLAGFQIAFITDPHVGGPHITLNVMRDIVDKTNLLAPDLILLGGDYIMNGAIRFVCWKKSISNQVAAELAKLQAPCGVFGVLGNHDWRDGGERIIREMTEHHIRMLEDDAAYIKHGDSGFWLVGISDYYEAAHDVKKAMATISNDDPIIALTHTPDLFPELPPTIALTLAGHTHGGQVNIPFVGSPAIPSKYGQRYARGFIQEGEKQLFVSPGIGTSILPIRFMAPPEVSMLTIYPQHG